MPHDLGKHAITGISREDLLQMLIHEPEYLLAVRTACDPRKMEEWYFFLCTLLSCSTDKGIFFPFGSDIFSIILKEENHG